MDADILRLILFLAGIALIVGIYFWDRHKKINVRVNAIHKAEHKRKERENDKPEIRREPVWQENAAIAEEPQMDERTVQEIDESLRKLGELVQEEGSDKRNSQQSGAGEQTAFEFTTDEAAPSSGRGSAVPTKIIQLNVLGRHGGISGDKLMQAARDLQLEPGEMQIFHRYDEQRNDARALFSVASMVEPGTFPFDDMRDFATPGVTLFAQLPGPRDGLELFTLMHESALRLAALLDGEVLDSSRSALSKQTVEHMREEISEHGRLVRLARSH
ncbi:MAG: cell division protein ZipA [Gammaproteobacteria bacterium]|nr:cell division protein ZipA [Gammaproteobacteria bacterium]